MEREDPQKINDQTIGQFAHLEAPEHQSTHNLVRPTGQGVCIVIMGVTASGKSTTGRFLGERLGFTFQDADVYHPAENLETMRAGNSLSDEQRGRFVDILIADIVDRTQKGENIVLAWSALKEVHRERFVEEVTQSVFVFLDISQDEAVSRAVERRKTDTEAVDANIVPNQFSALERPNDAIVVNAKRPLDEILKTIISATEVNEIMHRIN